MSSKIEFKNRRIEVSFDKTVQVKQFEPLKLHAAFSADISDIENIEEAYEEIFILLENIVGKELNELEEE